MMVPGTGVAAGLQAASPAANTDWKAQIEARRQALIAKNGPGTDVAERDELLKMRGEDQRARGIGTQGKGAVQIATNLTAIDNALTEELKVLVKAKGWPTISQVGIEASNAAMLILTHTRDHAWQVGMLPELENLADEKKIDPSALALVIDKELVYEGKLQRYGTQFKQMADGSIAMYSVEDPGGLDRERAEVMLPPIDVYKGMLAGMYHLKVSNKIVMAVAQGK
ncbi:DUF6624 domain-containing protein [Granulicella sp. 5B5]|uniref:DUF6624 domain-containing protein n=1 Tax=Granulicella sp. 5B5 TaxID=1617967 RepID=UPI0021058C0C|nr:DUF6624 domain-containing protein [Granulicella sp. 5B5]